MMQFKDIQILLAIGLVLFLSGCIEDQEVTKPAGQISPTPTLNVSTTPAISTADTQISQSLEQNKINELEKEVNSMQQQIKDLQTRLDALGLPKPSNKNLIPNIPFRIEVKFAQSQSPVSWTFRENSEIEIRDSGLVEYGTYRIFSKNNTIQFNSEKYDFNGIVLYDDYATAIYDGGWIAWTKKYQLIPPIFNTVTQKYELD